MERGDDLSLSVTVEDDLVIARPSGVPTRDYAVELPDLIRTLADALSDPTVPRGDARDRTDTGSNDTFREKAWDLAQFVMGTVTRSHPDWDAIELCAGELAELAGHLEPTDG